MSKLFFFLFLLYTVIKLFSSCSLIVICSVVRSSVSYQINDSKCILNLPTCLLSSFFVHFSASTTIDGISYLTMIATCRYFMYDGRKHSCIEGDHIVNIFSFSKAYGMMGWRVGYVSNRLPFHIRSM